MARSRRRTAGRSTPSARPEADDPTDADPTDADPTDADPNADTEQDDVETTQDVADDAAVEAGVEGEAGAEGESGAEPGDGADDDAEDVDAHSGDTDEDSADADADADADDADSDDADDDTDGDADDDDDDADDREPVLAGAVAKGRGSRTAGRTKADDAPAQRGTRSKGRATPRRRTQTQAERRTGPIEFLRESYSELRKVVYPSRKTLWTYFLVVLVFVLFVIGYITVLDLGFGWVILKVFG